MRHLIFFLSLTCLLFAGIASAQTINQVIIHSPAGDPVGRGRDTTLIAGPELNFTCDVNDYNGIQFEVRSADQSYFWYVFLANATRTPLTPGEYNDCVRYPSGSDWTHHKLDIIGNGAGCNSLTGRFIIKELTWASESEIATLWAIAEEHCEGRYPMVTVEIRYNLNQSTSVHPRSWGSLKSIYR